MLWFGFPEALVRATKFLTDYIQNAFRFRVPLHLLECPNTLVCLILCRYLVPYPTDLLESLALWSGCAAEEQPGGLWGL